MDQTFLALKFHLKSLILKCHKFYFLMSNTISVFFFFIFFINTLVLQQLGGKEKLKKERKRERKRNTVKREERNFRGKWRGRGTHVCYLSYVFLYVLSTFIEGVKLRLPSLGYQKNLRIILFLLNFENLEIGIITPFIQLSITRLNSPIEL